MSYIITRNDYNKVTIDFTLAATPDVYYSYKINKLNPVTNEEDNIVLPLIDEINYSRVGKYIKIFDILSASISINVTDDGIYYLYIQNELGEEYKHVIINVKNITDYLFETAQDNICCCPTKPCNEYYFSHRDYVFNVVSNMSFSFLGWEFRDINSTVDNLPSGLYNRLFETSEIIYRINQYLLSSNFEYSC